jgi:hypothetical protein
MPIIMTDMVMEVHMAMFLVAIAAELLVKGGIKGG